MTAGATAIADAVGTGRAPAARVIREALAAARDGEDLGAFWSLDAAGSTRYLEWRAQGFGESWRSSWCEPGES